MSMNKNTFWRIIDEVNSEVSRTDLDGIIQTTKDKLRKHTPQEIAVWGDIQRYYKELANTSGIFAASCCLNNYMSANGFTDFRMWLISQGKDVYMAALKDPDSLAGLDIPENTRFEVYGYISIDAYADVSKGDIFGEPDIEPLTEARKEDIRAELEYLPHSVTDLNAKSYLPNLYAKYMEPGASLSFSYWPRSPYPKDLMTGLDKLKNGAVMIEDITGNVMTGFFIYPDECISLETYKEDDYSTEIYRICFDLKLQTKIIPADPANLFHVNRVSDDAYNLICKLELDTYSLTPEEMQEFGDFLRQRKELREAPEQANSPTIGQQ